MYDVFKVDWQDLVHWEERLELEVGAFVLRVTDTLSFDLTCSSNVDWMLSCILPNTKQCFYFLVVRCFSPAKQRKCLLKKEDFRAVYRLQYLLLNFTANQVLVFPLVRGLKPGYYSGEREGVHVKAKCRKKPLTRCWLFFRHIPDRVPCVRNFYNLGYTH